MTSVEGPGSEGMLNRAGGVEHKRVEEPEATIPQVGELSGREVEAPPGYSLHPVVTKTQVVSSALGVIPGGAPARRKVDYSSAHLHEGSAGTLIPAHLAAQALALASSSRISPTLDHSSGTVRRFDESQVKQGGKLGAGAFGEVCIVSLPGGQKGALRKKIIGTNPTRSQREDFAKEVRSIVAMQGAVGMPKLLGLIKINGIECPILEYCEGGDLKTRIESSKILNPVALLTWASDIGEGVAAAHKENLLHRDLAARNVLLQVVDGEERALVSDLGLSEFLPKSADKVHVPSNVGPVLSTAPEALRKKEYSKATDVWAFGVTLFEVFTQGEPYPGVHDLDVRAQVLKGDFHPDTEALRALYKSSGQEPLGKALADFLDTCFAQDPSKRPTMEKAVSEIRRIASENGITLPKKLADKATA